jgi:hypothetical protein
VPDVITRDFVTDEVIDYTITLPQKSKNEWNIFNMLMLVYIFKYIFNLQYF